MQVSLHRSTWLFLLLEFAIALGASGETFRVATYNVEGYLLTATGNRPAKSEESREKVCESIVQIKPDVLALQEIGGTEALRELQQRLKGRGVDLPFSEHVPGFDTNIQVAVLSRFPFVERRSHSHETFLLRGRRFRTSRGFGEVEIRVSPEHSFVLLVAHLKSKRIGVEADEGDMRVEEARLLRDRIDALLDANPKVNLLLAGDLNDTKDSPAVRLLTGRAQKRLVDTRPAERNGDVLVAERNRDPRVVAWTHYYARQDAYSRIDYLMLSAALARHWLPEESYVLSQPGWGLASDHRPIVIALQAPGH